MKKITQLCLLLFLASCSQEKDVMDNISLNLGDNMTNKNMQEAELFLDSNLANDGVIEVESGLQYLVMNSGDASTPTPLLSDTITAHFHGTLLDGTVFWSSVDMNEPLTIKPSQLNQGCQKILPLMRVGDKWKVFIHPDMAYGEEGRPTIPSNSVLIFDLELLAIE